MNLEYVVYLTSKSEFFLKVDVFSEYSVVFQCTLYLGKGESFLTECVTFHKSEGSGANNFLLSFPGGVFYSFGGG